MAVRRYPHCCAVLRNRNYFVTVPAPVPVLATYLDYKKQFSKKNLEKIYLHSKLFSKEKLTSFIKLIVKYH
jgi:hypothetical protein